MLRVYLACLMACLIISCSADRTPQLSTVDSAVTVGPAGLTLNLPDNARLTIPAGALTKATKLGFKEAETKSLPALPRGMMAVSAIYELTPHGLNFEKSVQMTLPHTAKTPRGLFLLRLDDEDDAAWDIVTEPVTLTAETVSIKLDHFSYYVVARYIMDDGGVDMDATVDPDATTGGPGCGNGKLDPDEVCDDGVNDGSYNSCTADCMGIGPRCGDGVIDDDGGEVCDDGINDDSYGGCAADCLSAGPYCGDGAVDPSGNEVCDDGVNDGGYDSCSADCLAYAAYCGDGQVDTDDSERCDPPDSCPAAADCVSTDACVSPAYSGDTADCSAACDLTMVISQCVNQDGCCPAACNSTNDDDCSATCGNGTVEAASGETCEAAVGPGCPASCDDGNPCTLDVRSGTAANCNVVCTHPPVLVGSADGCCLPGANANNDADCAPTCGNGAVETGEVCDSSCPSSCADPAPTNACIGARLEGDPQKCTSKCVRTMVSTNQNADGCCLPGVSFYQDSDCPAICGNRVVETQAGEACDDGVNNGGYGGCAVDCLSFGPTCGDNRVDAQYGERCDPPGSCPSRASCISPDACVVPVYSGSRATCNAFCDLTTTISQCINQDGCCPSGCTTLNDNDCSATCGNGVVEDNAGETCEPGVGKGCPSSCDDGDPCTLDVRTGTTANCNVVCTSQPVQVGAVDGCCLPTANANNDADCSPSCGNTVIEAGEVCEACPAGQSCGYQCPSTCVDPAPNDACVGAQLIGDPNKCTARCARTQITTAVSGDGCCLPGGTFAQDSDCPCGDGKMTGTEACDDGTNNGQYGTCNPGCQSLAPYCGDAILNGKETCDVCPPGQSCSYACPTSCPDPDLNDACVGAQRVGDPAKCTAACMPTQVTTNIDGDGCCLKGATYADDIDCPRTGPTCGDGTIQSPEVCDDGKNNGTLGSCMPGCVTPYCGDGVINGNDTCDVGTRNGTYNGPCNSTCSDVGPRCGDGNVDKAGGEVCDDGKNDGTSGSCLKDCSASVP